MEALSTDFLAALYSAVRTVLLAALLYGLWRGLQMAGVERRARIATWLAVAVPLVAWCLAALELAQAGVFQPGPVPSPAIPLAVLVPLGLGLVLLTRSKNIAAAIDAVPASWLVGVQVYRVLGAIFLVHWSLGRLPGEFALPAGIGDVLVGLAALPVALYLASGARGGRAAAYAWNLLGIADLASALTLGFLTTPGRFQQLAFDHPNTFVGTYPLVMIPTFAVPLSLILHGLSLWQLRRNARDAAPLAGRLHLGHGIRGAA